MVTHSRQELREIFESQENRSPKISVSELAELISIEKEKVRDYHFEEWFDFVFDSVGEIIKFAESNKECRKCISFLSLPDFARNDYCKSKNLCCARLARFRRITGGCDMSYFNSI